MKLNYKIFFAIGHGLKEGERILLEGLRKVNNNEKISYKYEDPKEVMASLKLFTE